MDGFMASGLVNNLHGMDERHRGVGHRNSGIYCHTRVPKFILTILNASLTLTAV
jgi:hypothetical protein